MPAINKFVSAIVVVGLLIFSFALSVLPVTAQTTATLSVSPSSASVGLNSNVNVTINVNTSGNPADGVDIYKLHFNSSILQVVDSNTGTAGVQIAPGSLLTNTAINSADNAAGTIQFSQSTSGGSSFTGSGTIATITFKGIATGTSALTFDFTPGSTADTNVAYQGADRLSSVTNGSIMVTAPDTSAPTVSITSPSNGAAVTGTVAVTASASDNVGVSGVQFKLDGSNLGSEDTAAPYSVSWNTSAVSAGTHTLTAVARDAAGNTRTSAAVSVTKSASFDFSLSNGGAKTVTQGSSVTNTITASLASGSAQTVSFSASGLPAGVSASFSPASCAPGCTSTATFSASASAAAGTKSVTVTGTAGSTSHTTSFNLTVSAGTFQRTINVSSLEGRNGKTVAGTVEVLSSASKTLLKSYNFTTNSSGDATITFDISPQTVYLKIKATPFLTRLLSNTNLSSNVTYSFPMLFIGDINQDNIINSVDYSVLNTNWFSSNASADLNQDGLVNSIDYSYMNKHWLLTGEQ